MNLPEEFLARMRDELGDDASFEAFVASYDRSPLKGIRLSTAKLTPDEYEHTAEILTGSHNRVPWTSCGYYSENETSGKDPYYHAGIYYPQEPSAMLPAEVLAARPGEIILDLCAAPGGKACRIGEDLKGKGLLVANEINAERSKALNRNIERTGITNCIILNESPENIASKLPVFFDKILIDAPCSGEGMFRRDPRAVTSWKEYGPASICKVQREILDQAVLMLKSGGDIVYSTCTFARVEDEDMIKGFLEEHVDFEIVPHREIDGVTHNDDGSMRIWPHLAEGDGHFCVHLRHKGDKSGSAYDLTPVPSSGSVNIKIKIAMMRYMSELLTADAYDELMRLCDERFVVQGAGLYLVPVDLRLFNGLKMIKSGLFLGEVKTTKTERVFTMSNSLPLALNSNMIREDSLISLERDSDMLIRYLKGETITIDMSGYPQLRRKGVVVIAVDGHPLGLGKIDNGTVKNMYPKAWRLV
ncbi:NOL1/NOP2/sun family putative RNA methylase [Ruminococcaceae bacterium YRB3002]|nr:NOL1/NOP2/sun family putative RNA methylase [Ruminococcaceae bacterium YRB3002]